MKNQNVFFIPVKSKSGWDEKIKYYVCSSAGGVGKAILYSNKIKVKEWDVYEMRGRVKSGYWREIQEEEVVLL